LMSIRPNVKITSSCLQSDVHVIKCRGEYLAIVFSTLCFGRRDVMRAEGNVLRSRSFSI
jgi:hypothetical protein